jgi:EAL domain-containing protein (putative c-di-GMP-specific phosphodiesterase class I)
MEGVETEEELNTVLTLAPDCIQGYYYDKPLKANQFEKKYLSA